MTVAALSPSASYLENGVTLAFAAPFRFLNPTHLEVKRISASGVVTTLAYGVDYSVSGGATDAGGTVTLFASTSGATLKIRRVTPRAQQTDYVTNDTFPAESHEAALDRQMLIDQEQDVKIGDTAQRALMWPEGEVAQTLPSKANFIGKYFAGDVNGDPVPAAGTGADAGLRTDLAGSAGAVLVGWIRAAVGAVVKSVSVKLGFRLDAEEFLPNNWVPSVTDVTAGMQAAINEASASGRTLYLPAAFRCGALTVPANVHLKGVGKKSVLTAIAGSYNLFTITGSEVKIENLYIEDLAKTGGWDFVIACGTNTIRRTNIYNIITQNSYGLITDSGTGTNGAGAHIVTKLIDVQTGLHRGPAMQMTRAFAFLYLERCSVDFVGVSASNFTAFSANLAGHGAAAGGMTMIDCAVLGTCGTYNNPNQHGFVISNTAAVDLVRCSADTVAGAGFIFDKVNTMHAIRLNASLCGSDGIRLTAVTNSTFEQTICGGRNYLTPNGAGTDGIRIISGCASVLFTGGLLANWGRHGFNKAAAQDGGVRVTSMLMLNNGLAGTGYGINDIGNSALSIASCGFGGNQQGNGNMQGIFSYYGLCQLNSGAGNQSGGPGPVVF